MYHTIIVYGGSKTGKTRLAKLLARITGAKLVDLYSPGDTDKVLHQTPRTEPLVITAMESKGTEEPFPRGSSLIMSLIAIHMPDLTITKNRMA